MKKRAIPGLGLALLLGAALCARAESWTENPAYMVQVDGAPSGIAHVFDSSDYQRMLLVLESKPAAAVLDLTTSSVAAVAAESLAVGSETIELDDAGGEYLAPLERNEGILSFTWDESKVVIAPVPPMIGAVELARILEMKPGYARDAAAYTPEPAALAALKAVATDTEFRVYFGTWCHLCKKLLPGFIRTIELAANPKLRVQYFGVDEDMTQPEAELQRDAVSKTPSIILYRGGREIGRIEEKVPTTVEAALAGIVAGGK